MYVSLATDLWHYDKTSTGTSTSTSHILQYILRYPLTHLLIHPLTQPLHILQYMTCIHSVSPTSQTYNVMTRHPLVQSTSSKASSNTATTHSPTYDVHSFPHPPAHLLACRHNLQHWHGTTSGIAPHNTMHLSPLPHAGIKPLMWYLPFMWLCLMWPSWITHYAWCGLFFTWSIFSIYMTYLSFPTFVPTSMQWRYSNLLLSYIVVAYVPTSMQWRCFDPVWLVHLSEAAQSGSLSMYLYI